MPPDQTNAPAAPPAEPGDAQPLIRIQGLSKRYAGRTVVDRLSLDVHAGEVFGLLGPNGAGKTTTILMLLGLTDRSAGTAHVVGLDPARHPLEVKRHVGYLPDNVGFYATLSGRENLRYTARLNGLSGAAGEQRIDELLEQVGLADAADAPAGTYSRGMRQRLGIADALVKDPNVVILDEPTIAIDPEGVTEVLAIIRALARERGAAVLLSSHLLYQVQSVCDRVGIFVGGRMIACGPMQELAEQLTSDEVVIELGAEGPEPAVEAALRATPGVLTVEREARSGYWVVTAEGDLRPQLVAAVTAAGGQLRHLRRRGQELDEIYHRYFTTTAGSAGAEQEDSEHVGG